MVENPVLHVGRDKLLHLLHNFHRKKILGSWLDPTRGLWISFVQNMHTSVASDPSQCLKTLIKIMRILFKKRFCTLCYDSYCGAPQIWSSQYIFVEGSYPSRELTASATCFPLAAGRIHKGFWVVINSWKNSPKTDRCQFPGQDSSALGKENSKNSHLETQDLRGDRLTWQKAWFNLQLVSLSPTSFDWTFVCCWRCAV